MKRSWIVLGLALTACSNQTQVEKVSWEEFEDRRLAMRGDIAVVYVWAEWSRRSVELLPSIVELGSEYEAAGIEMALLRLDGAAETVDGAVAQYQLSEDFEGAMARLGLSDLPAAVIYSSDGKLRYRLENSAEAPLTPADIADATESLMP